MSKLHISSVQLCARLTVCKKTKKKTCRSRRQFRMIAAAHKDTNSMQMNPECTLHNAHARKFVTWKWCDKTSTVVAFHTHAIFARFGSYFCDRSYVVCARHVYFRNSCILHTNTPRNVVQVFHLYCLPHGTFSKMCVRFWNWNEKSSNNTHMPINFRSETIKIELNKRKRIWADSSFFSSIVARIHAIP